MNHFFSKVSIVFFLVAISLAAACPNGCSNRGLCINNACVCAEGLSGNDCSQKATSNLPTLYECPSCYAMTLGSAQYVSGPSWRLPDGPIVGLNYQGRMIVYQGNGNGEIISNGTSIYDWVNSPIEALQGGTSGNFDSCGSWIMRAFAVDSSKVIGFYHAETACDYSNNEQTRKSGGYALSMDGGRSFSKPSYPNNRILDTSTPVLNGLPSGEGDFSVVLKDDYYYMFFANVETYHTGVARAPKISDASPGSFQKYLNGKWDSPAVGGTSSRLNNLAGPQAYLHTPSQSFVAVGNFNPYWNSGFMMSVSDDALNWKFFADPVFTPDQTTNIDQIMYPSFLGRTAGYDIGSNFQFHYMWVPPGNTWQSRYQVFKDVTLTYVGYNSTMPSVKLALTTYKASDSGETWQTTELALAPYNAVDIVGYIMTRPYPFTFVIYDCYNYTTKDHFVGTADECFLSGAGVEVVRTLGYIWASRVAPSVAIYRCRAGTDTFLSIDKNCDGLAPAQTKAFGYVMSGPAFTLSEEVLIPQGSTWKFQNTSIFSYAPNSTWTLGSFDDSTWRSAKCPFGNSYATVTSYFGPREHYFRSTFTIPPGKSVSKLLLSVSSDDYAMVYINGALVDSDTVKWHEAAYWNRRVYIDASSVVTGTNTIAVVTKNGDAWAYFDLELRVTYDTAKRMSARSVEEAEEKEHKPVRNVPVYERSKEARASLTALVPQGSNWRYFFQSQPASTWTQLNFDDSAWAMASAPFVTGYSAYTGKTPFGKSNYYFRYKFTVAAGRIATSLQLNVASDDTAIVYINGAVVDADPATWHEAKYWNRQVSVDGSLLVAGDNMIAVVTKNMDQWAFFDLLLNVEYAAAAALPNPIVIPQGSTWLFWNKSAPADSWVQQSFDDSAWSRASAPFVTGYSAYTGKTPFGKTDHYFRSKFTLPTGYTVSQMQVSVASDNYAMVYVNGILVDSDPSPWHQAAYWNRQVLISTALLTTGTNQIAVVTKNMDDWAFFDLQLTASFTFGAPTPAPTPTPTPTPRPTVAPPPSIPTNGGVLIAQGSSWKFFNKSVPVSTWSGQGFDDSTWNTGAAPFVTGYNAYVGKGTPFGATDYYFRSQFTIPAGVAVKTMQLSIASDNYALVYVNGQLVDKDPLTWHEAKYWNRQINIDTSSIVTGSNTIAVIVKNGDQWAFFDLQLTVVYGDASQVAPNGLFIPQGSRWSYVKTQPAPAWIQQNFDDSAWAVSVAPFVTGYGAFAGQGTPFDATDYYFRSKFTVPGGSRLKRLQLFVASDNTATVYINGVVVDADPAVWHEAKYWNRQVYVDTSVIVPGSNTIAVVTKNQDKWAFFDLQLKAEFAPDPSLACTPGCGVMGQCMEGKCVCDAGWGGVDCSVSLCAFTERSNETVIPSGSSFRHTPWATVRSTPAGWFAPSFDDAWWQIHSAPFGTTGYSNRVTTIPYTRHLYRKKFLIDVPYNKVVQSAILSIASDDTHRVFINGKFVGDTVFPYNPHSAKRWNAVMQIDGSYFDSVNMVSVEIPQVDGRWTTYFDMQLVVTYATRTCSPLA